MGFPLFRRPGAVVFLDDDADYLEMLALVLPRDWQVELFIRPQTCLNYLQQQPPHWEADAWIQQRLVERWQGGTPLIPLVLHYWSTQPDRFELAKVCVFDYSMPGMSGLEALAELVDWPGARVLLTGQADEQVAVRAFNSGLIEQFIAKQAPDISQRLVDAVRRLMAQPHPRHDHLWRSTLSPKQDALLRLPAVSQDLEEFSAKRWVEHVVIGEPFGILGLDARGNASWLQLELAEGLEDLANLAKSQGVPAASLIDIRHGKRLVDLELRQALNRREPPLLQPAFHIGTNGKLLGAEYPLAGTATTDLAANSQAAWLAQHSARHVRD